MLAVFLFSLIESSGCGRSVGSRRSVSLKLIDSEAHHTAIPDSARHAKLPKWRLMLLAFLWAMFEA
jgi:hypothetical protein